MALRKDAVKIVLLPGQLGCLLLQLGGCDAVVDATAGAAEEFAAVVAAETVEAGVVAETDAAAAALGLAEAVVAAPAPGDAARSATETHDWEGPRQILQAHLVRRDCLESWQPRSFL